MKKVDEIIIDSEISLEMALAQNPKAQAPADILSAQVVSTVEYFGFDWKKHRGQIVMNSVVIDDVKEFFELALKTNFPIKKVIPICAPQYKWDDIISCGDNNSSGFNFRYVSGDPTRLSNHAKGLAFDINPVENIYVRYDKDLSETFRYPPDGVYDLEAKGTLLATSSLVLLMKKLGWDWGGDWTPESGRIDYQHFEKKI